MKRGGLQITLDNLIGLVLGAILIGALIFFVGGIYNIFSNKPDQSAIDNLQALSIVINNLTVATGGESFTFNGHPIEIRSEELGKKFTAKVPIYIQDDFGIVGFDSDITGQTCGPRHLDLKRPVALCPQAPCVCLDKLGYITVNDFKSCRPLDNVKYISATTSWGKLNYGVPHPTGDTLALWSGCMLGPTFQVRTINIIREPSDEPGKYNIKLDLVQESR